MTTDLFERYGLEEIASSVARVDDDGKKKIVRKTYKNYMRVLSGAFDSVKKDDGAPDTMLFIMQLPQEEWDAKTGRTAEVEKGLPEEALANIGKAMTMTRGVIPMNVWDPKGLGELSNKPATPVVKTQPNGVKKPVPLAQTAALPRAVKGEVARPKRATTKRSYGDSSYEGYGEGYVDDDMRDAGSFTGGDDDEDRPGGRKRPKKVCIFLRRLSVMANLERTLPPRISKARRAKILATGLGWSELESL